MNVLFICTSNKDRSPALEAYFTHHFPANSYRSAGVNKYFTEIHRTHYLTHGDITWADLIVFAEDVHSIIAYRDFGLSFFQEKNRRTLNIGEYNPQNKEDYLVKAGEYLRSAVLNYLTHF